RVPESTPAGTELRLVATATDGAGNVRTQQAVWTVLAPAAPSAGTVVAGAFVGAEQLAVSGDTVFARTATGFAVGTLSRGATPSLTHVGTYSASLRPLSMAVAGSVVLLAYGEAGVDVIDVSTPASPVKVGHANGDLGRLASYAGRVYATHATHSYLYVIDVSDPSRPFVAMLNGYQGRVLSAHVDGLLYQENGWVLTHYRQPGQPTGAYVTRSDWLGSTGTVLAERDTGVVVLADGLLRLYSANLDLEASMNLPAPGRAMRVVDGRVYVLDTDGRLRVVDVREQHNAAVVASEPLDGSDLAISGGLMLVATQAGVELRRLPVPSADVVPVATATQPLASPPLGLTAYRGGVLAAAGPAGLANLELSLPGRFLSRPSNPNIPDVRQVERVGRTVYLLTGTALQEAYEQPNGSLAYAFNSGNNAYLHQLGAVTRFHVASRRLWALGGGRVSTATLPGSESRASLLMAGGAVDVSGDERRAVVAHGAGGWSLVGLESSGELRRLATFAGTAADAVALEGGLLVTGNA
ncbi:hypothetical protein ACLESO_56785, partial [Pyxidicoccus sp. 3LG]